MNFKEYLRQALNEQAVAPWAPGMEPTTPSRMPLDNPRIPLRPGMNPQGNPYSNPCQDLGIGCGGEPILYGPTQQEMEEWGWTPTQQEWFQQNYPSNYQEWYWQDGGFFFIDGAGNQVG